MKLRPVTPDDADTVARHRYPEAADAPERPVYAAWLRDAVTAGKYVGLLMLDGSDVVAGAGLTLLDWGPTRGNPDPIRARLVNVWTDPEYRRRGLARQLTVALLNEARTRGIRTVSLGTTDIGRPLYESLGFKAYPHEMLLKLEVTA